MNSDSSKVNCYKSTMEASSPVVPLNKFNKQNINIILDGESQDFSRSRRLDQLKFRSKVNQNSLNIGYSKPSSCPNGFLDNISESKPIFNQEAISNSISEQDSEEDTNSFLDSGDGIDDVIANEIKSRNEADDELASIFGSDDT